MATLSKGKTFTNGETVTPQKLHELVDLGSVTNIQAADIATGAVTTAKIADAAVTTAKIADGNVTTAKLADAAVTDAKLATIATAGKVANSATTAVSANTASAIVARDASGNFSAGTITATLSGNATNVTGTIALANGGTGATTATAARTNLGLGNSATLNTGTTTGTVATGDHTHTFGTTLGTFCQGNDTRLSDSRPPTSHTHGNITNAGAIGTTAGVPIITGTSGVLAAGSFGTTLGTFCQGNDTRLSDSRPPTSHNHDDLYYTEAEINTLLSNKQPINVEQTLGLNWSNGVKNGIRFSSIPAGVKKFTLIINTWKHGTAGQPGTGVVCIGTTASGLLTVDSSGFFTPVTHSSYFTAVNNLENIGGFSITGGTATSAEHVGVMNFYVTTSPVGGGIVGSTPPATYTSRLVCESHISQIVNNGNITILQGTGYIDYGGSINEIIVRSEWNSSNASSASATIIYYF